jgi:hypothetical protein
VYHPELDEFFFFSSNASNILLKTFDEAHEKKNVYYRREVELFRCLKELEIEQPDLVYIPTKELEPNVEDQTPPPSLIYILNNLATSDARG